MKKRFLVILLAALSLIGAVGCGSKHQIERRVSENVVVEEKNKTSLFTGEKLSDVCFGLDAGAMCSVKIGSDYLINGRLANAAEGTTELKDGTKVSDLKTGIDFLSSATVTTPDEQKNIFTIEITSSYPVDELDAMFQTGIRIKDKAYITDDTENGEILFAYPVNYNSILYIHYTGEASETMSLEELGEEFYGLITPYEDVAN